MEGIVRNEVEQDDQRDLVANVEEKRNRTSAKWKSLFKWKSLSIKALLVVIALGIWANVLQNAGIIPSAGKQVCVVGGDIGANVTGEVDVKNTVDVDVQNQVGVDIEGVLGAPIGCHKSYTINGQDYYAIDVFKRNNW